MCREVSDNTEFYHVQPTTGSSAEDEIKQNLD